MGRIRTGRLAFIACAITASISGCMVQPLAHDTIGQELIDLGRARDAGQLNPEEYALLRDRIVSSGSSAGLSREWPRLEGPRLFEAVKNVTPSF